jgi:membrane protein YdbS with pleckstrin-like domain
VILREPGNQLDPRVRSLWRAEALIGAGILAALVAAATVLTALAGATEAALAVGALGGATVLALGAVAALLLPGLRYRRFRYEVTELGLYVARGALWRRWQVVPHARVQTVDTRAGPLERVFGLVEAQVTTASAAGGTSIPGLAPEVADRLVLELARHAEVEEGT